MSRSVTVEAGANIAFIKYWGNLESGGNLPLNPSISMTLRSCVSRTTVRCLDPESPDEYFLDGQAVNEKTQVRLNAFMDTVRSLAGNRQGVSVRSENRFPTGCGIASSASGFAALAVAATAAFGLQSDARELSRIARLGSGSAARSVMGGFVELHAAVDHENAYAEQLASEETWPELRDLIVIVSQHEKTVSSSQGHRIAHTSEMLSARLAAVAERAERVREAIRTRDPGLLGLSAEADALSMHAVMLTSQPPLIYWHSGTIEVLKLVHEMREEGIEAYFTIDAGPNVHVLTTATDLPQVEARVREKLGFRTIADEPGPGARIVEDGAG